MVVPRPSTYFSEALISAQLLTAGSLRCPVGVNIPSLVASRSFHFARAEHALGEQGVAQVEARAILFILCEVFIKSIKIITMSPD